MRVGTDAEPATVPRLRQLLRRAGITGARREAAMGCSIERYLELNPRLPLWAAVAWGIELDGEHTPKIAKAFKRAETALIINKEQREKHHEHHRNDK